MTGPQQQQQQQQEQQQHRQQHQHHQQHQQASQHQQLLHPPQQQQQQQHQQAPAQTQLSPPPKNSQQHAQQKTKQQHKQQQQQVSIRAAPMIAPAQVPAHLMGIVGNPTVNVATASPGSQLFPPAAMLSNPGAFLAMPEAFAAAAAAAAQSAAQSSAPGGVVLPRIQPSVVTGYETTIRPSTYPNPPMNQPQQNLTGNAAATAHQNIQNIGVAVYPQRNGQVPVQIIPSTVDSMQESHDDGLHDESKTRTRRTDLTPEERAKQNRDRNREHARSTRLRKKAYVQKLKELIEGLHAERTEDVRQRRVATQHLAEIQNVRRGVVRSFLSFLSSYEADARKWATILEDDFWLKQPVTPYRSFRRTELEQDCRISRGIKGVMADAASISVMVATIGSRSARWMQIKREEFFRLEGASRRAHGMPRSIVRQDSRLQNAVSSLSSSSGSSNGSASDEADKQRKQSLKTGKACNVASSKKAVAQGTSSNDESRDEQQPEAKDFHDYHAQPLPDPKLGDSGSSSPSEDSPEEANSTNRDTKRVCTDSSSGDDSAAAIAAPRALKRQKASENGDESNGNQNMSKPGTAAAGRADGSVPGVDLKSRLRLAPAIPLPPFTGIGKRATLPSSVINNKTAPQKRSTSAAPIVRIGADAIAAGSANGSLSTPAVVTGDTETSSSNSSQIPQVKAYFHINEDDMILMEDVLMCPFVFRSQDAVVCGALSECIMPGMFRAHFSPRNKLYSVEMVYDAMGFMQQLERASGSERTAQIIPGSLEMALSPNSSEARVITLAEPPFLIVNVSEVWTRLTKYTQMEVEGKELLSLLSGDRPVPNSANRPGKPSHRFENVAKGLTACATYLHYDKDGREFVNFICSYPLTNANDEITHLLHSCKLLPVLPAPL